MKKSLMAAALAAAIMATTAHTSDVGLPHTIPGMPGLTGLPDDPTDLCELIGNPYCKPKVIPECKPGSLIWPQCEMFKTGGEIPWPQLYEQEMEIDWGQFIKSGGTSPVTEVTSASASINDDKIFINAQGAVNSGGWSEIHLQQKVYFMPPEDGIQEISFLGAKPSGLRTFAYENVLASLTMLKPDWVKGVRIVAGSNSMSVALVDEETSTAKTQTDDEFWPFPWDKTFIQ